MNPAIKKMLSDLIWAFLKKTQPDYVPTKIAACFEADCEDYAERKKISVAEVKGTVSKLYMLHEKIEESDVEIIRYYKRRITEYWPRLGTKLVDREGVFTTPIIEEVVKKILIKQGFIKI